MDDWTPKKARAKCKRKLKSLRKRAQDVCEDIAYEFGDFHNGVVLQADSFRDSLLAETQRLEEELDDAAETENA